MRCKLLVALAATVVLLVGACSSGEEARDTSIPAAPTLSTSATTPPTDTPPLSATGASTPTAPPTAVQTVVPTPAPPAAPTVLPTPAPTAAPAMVPTPVLTAAPNVVPTPDPAAAPTVQPTPAPTATPSVPRLLLPFKIGEVYDPVTKSRGELSYAGKLPIIPFGGNYPSFWSPGENPDIWFELVPGTILRASATGRIRAVENEFTWNGVGERPEDWEVHIAIEGTPYYVAYDHVAELRVDDGQEVQAGDPIGRATPASTRHGGPEALKPVDEFEWGLRLGHSAGATSFCPLLFVSDEDVALVEGALLRQSELGFESGPSACLVERLD